jgi:predicted Holliday junction resolvase-like endonuclease
MKTIEKYIILLCCFVLAASYINAQSIKEQIEQQKQQEQYEREQRETQLKEEARIKKAQLNLNDLLQLLQSKDADYVDNYLKERGWKLHSTNVKETNDSEIR